MTGRLSAMRAARQASLGTAIAAVSMALAPPAAAQIYDSRPLFARTCATAEVGRTEASRQRLASFVLADIGVWTNDPDHPVADPVQWIRDAFTALETPSGPNDIQKKAINAVLEVQRVLANVPEGGAARIGFAASPVNRGDLFWLFGDRVTLECIKRAPAPAGDTRIPGIANGNLEIRLRASPDLLNVTDDALRTAGAAQFSFRRERVLLDNGSRRHDTSISVKGALGLVIDERPASAGYLYVGYELQRLRTTPPPTLAPGASQRDKDTDVVELGITGFRVLRRNRRSTFNLMLSGGASVIFDRVDNSERLRVNLSAVPGFDPTSVHLPFCGIGMFRTISGGLGARCNIMFRLQANHFLNRGTGTPVANDEFVLGGGEVGIEFAQMDSGRLRGGGVIAGASYRYEARLHGDVPAIDRFSAFLKYRHWLGGARPVGLDVGLNFVDGTNPESFADEHRVTFGFGLIF